MHDNVFYNGRIILSADVRINGVSSAALYGKGVFTTVAIHDKEPFLWEKHWIRLRDNAESLRIDLSAYSKDLLKSTLDEIIERNKLVSGRARVTLFDESSSGIWRFDTKSKTCLLIATADFRVASENFRLIISPGAVNSKSPLAGIKSCNYLEKIMLLDEAANRGFDEAVCLNERGEIASACMANVFWLNGERLFTPSLKTGCLPGTTRAFLLETLECSEVEETIDALQIADAVFLTSVGNGVVQAAEFDGRKLHGRPHKILELLPKRT